MIKVPGLSHYYGGKGASGVPQTIINFFPPHDIYFELFLGGGSIMKYKKPAPVYNLGMDIDSNIIDLWKNATNFPQEKGGYTFKQGCAIEFLKSLFTENNFFNDINLKFKSLLIYLDPTYIIGTRKSKKAVYKYELSFDQHIELLQTITLMETMIILNGITYPEIEIYIAISCYEHPVYSKFLKDWYHVTFKSQTRNGVATEHLYMNYPKPKELHDYNFLGKNFRERERIRNKIKRHVNRLKQLPILERNAILDTFKNEFFNHIK